MPFAGQRQPYHGGNPVHGYARQDPKARGREPITAKLMADLLETAGVTRVVTIDGMRPRFRVSLTSPLTICPAGRVLADYIKEKISGT